MGDLLKILLELFGIFTCKTADKKLKYIRFKKRLYRQLKRQYKKGGLNEKEKAELKKLKDEILKDTLEL